MEDILLTHDQLMDESQKAHEAYDALRARGEDMKWTDWWYVWLLRAQVRNVVEWLERNPETDIDAGTLIALRAAGGEG